jgi:hypothetical protein
MHRIIFFTFIWIFIIFIIVSLILIIFCNQRENCWIILIFIDKYWVLIVLGLGNGFLLVYVLLLFFIKLCMAMKRFIRVIGLRRWWLLIFEISGRLILFLFDEWKYFREFPILFLILFINFYLSILFWQYLSKLLFKK